MTIEQLDNQVGLKVWQQIEDQIYNQVDEQSASRLGDLAHRQLHEQPFEPDEAACYSAHDLLCEHILECVLASTEGPV